MSILTERLSKGIIINNIKYPVHTSFRNWIEIDRLIFDADAVNNPKATAEILALCYIKLPPDLTTAYDGIFTFLYPPKADNNKIKKGDKTHSQGTSRSRGYSFYYDADIIFADFYRFYNINLQQSDLHWHMFYTLFKGLPEDSRIRQIIDIRTRELKDVKDKKLRAEYIRLKRIWALPDNRSEEEKEKDFANTLW